MLIFIFGNPQEIMCTIVRDKENADSSIEMIPMDRDQNTILPRLRN